MRDTEGVVIMSLFKSLGLIKNENSVSDFFPVTHLLSPTIATTRNSELISVIRVGGLSFATSRNEILNQIKLYWHQAVMTLNDQFCVYVTTHRKKINLHLGGEFTSPFIRTTNEAYFHSFNDTYSNDIYITLVRKGALIGKVAGKVSGFKLGKYRRKNDAIRQDSINDFDRKTRSFMSLIGKFSPMLLGDHDADLGYSDLIYYLSLVVNGGEGLKLKKNTMPYIFKTLRDNVHHYNMYPMSHLGQYVSQHAIAVGDHINFKSRMGSEGKYAAMLSIKSYPESTASIMLDSLLCLPCEFIMTHSFAIMDKSLAHRRISKHHNKLNATDDYAKEQNRALHNAHADLASNKIMMGNHQHVLMITSSDFTTLHEHVSAAMRAYLDAGIIAVCETLGAESAFWSQIPGNQGYSARSSLISSINFVDMASLHNYPRGHFNQNYLTGAVSVALTPAKTPFYFNLHLPGSDDTPTPGHTLIIGGNGSGKTVSMCFIDTQISRYGGRSVFFDRNRGMEVYIRACGGQYIDLQSDSTSRTKMNPFFLPNTHANKTFVKSWMYALVKHENENELPDSVCRDIEYCVDYAFTHLCVEDRCLSNVCKRLAVDFPRWDRMRRWIRGFDGYPDGEYAYLFDHDVDELSFCKKVGFDMTHFLDNEPQSVLSCLVMYLFYRIEQLLDGRLTSIYLDEGWQYLDNNYWRVKMKRWFPTLRKMNCHLIFATQSAKSITSSSIYYIIMDNIATQIYFPNPQADEATYCNELNLTRSELECIKTCRASSHYFLYKQSNESVLIKFPLEQLKDELIVFSATKKSTDILASVLAEHDSITDDWLPTFLSRMK